MDRVCVDTGISALETLAGEGGKSQVTVNFWDISMAESRDLGDRVRMFFHVNTESIWSRDTGCCLLVNTVRRGQSRQSLWDLQLCQHLQYGAADPREAQGWLLSLHCDSHILF